jgi:hypothetical protein
MPTAAPVSPAPIDRPKSFAANRTNRFIRWRTSAETSARLLRCIPGTRSGIAPGMARTRTSEYLKNHVIAMWRYWQDIPVLVRDELRGQGDYSAIFSVLQPYYKEAAGRLTILQRMVRMKHDDIVFMSPSRPPLRTVRD